MVNRNVITKVVFLLGILVFFIGLVLENFSTTKCCVSNTYVIIFFYLPKNFLMYNECIAHRNCPNLKARISALGGMRDESESIFYERHYTGKGR